jgi:AcrR family transcriptional regulator
VIALGASRRRVAVRDQLIASSVEIFSRKGYRATSLEDIASVLGLRKGSLYHYMASKQDLLAEIYSQLMTHIEGVIKPIAESHLPAHERLRRMVIAHIYVVANKRDMLAIVVREEPELNEVNRKQAIARKRDYEMLFERVVIEAQEAGDMRRMAPRIVVLALLGMTNWMYQWYRADRHSAEQVAGELLLLLERGWAADGDDREVLVARAESVGEALAGADAQIQALRANLEKLTVQLERARRQLTEGLLPPQSRKSRGQAG